MPSHAILVKNNVLSTYTDAIESQLITISFGSSSITPNPTDIAKWFTTTAGPEKGTTLLEVNSANITAYLTDIAQTNNAVSSPSTTNSISSAAVSNTTSQIARALLSYNGATVSL